MNRRYQIIGKEDKEKLSEFLVRHGQFLLPMVELIERSRVAVDEVIEVLGRALSANIDETLTLPEFSVEGGEGIDDGNDGCYAIIHLGGGSDGQANAASI